jgi:hypothetical protein
MNGAEVRRIAAAVLGDSVAAHKRRVALRQGRREPVRSGGCSHANWDAVKKWCDDCGATPEELVSGD